MNRIVLACLAGMGAVLGSINEVLAESSLICVSVGAQSPAAINAGGTATYTVSLTRTNSGRQDIYLRVSGLPAGATASFSPSPVIFTGSTPSNLTATLTVSTAMSVADGTYPFSVIGREGQSHNFCSGAGTLLVGSGGPQAGQAPFILSIWLRSDNTPEVLVSGTPGVPYQLQATPDLSAPVWSSVVTNVADANGLFTFRDAGWMNYSMRFYRAAKVQ